MAKHKQNNKLENGKGASIYEFTQSTKATNVLAIEEISFW
jgi:hypothetical protein